MIPATLPVMANVASVVTALLAVGRRIRERGAYLHNTATDTFPRGDVIISRRDWQPTTMTERIRDYLAASHLPDFPGIKEDMRLF